MPVMKRYRQTITAHKNKYQPGTENVLLVYCPVTQTRVVDLPEGSEYDEPGLVEVPADTPLSDWQPVKTEWQEPTTWQ